MKTKMITTNCPRQMAFVKNVVRDPILFASHVLGVNLWQREAEILHSIKHNRRTALKRVTESAKRSHSRMPRPVVACPLPRGHRSDDFVHPTASKHPTVVRDPSARRARQSDYPNFKSSTELKFRDENNFAIGFSTNQSENFWAITGKNVLIIADEAPGIESGIWDAIAGTMAGGNVHIVMAGNPTIPSGAFYDAFTKDRGLWNCFSINVFDSPNFKGITLEQLLEIDHSEGGPLDQNLIPYLVTKRWAHDQRQTWWHGDAASSPHWMSRVLAEFPSQAEDALFR